MGMNQVKVISLDLGASIVLALDIVLAVSFRFMFNAACTSAT